MSAAKLTPAQVRTLASIAATGFWPSGGHYATRAVLIEADLIEVDPTPSRMYAPTVAGLMELAKRGVA